MKRYAAMMLVLGLVSCGGDDEVSGERPAECPEIVYAGQGAEPSSFHREATLLVWASMRFIRLTLLEKNLCSSMPDHPLISTCIAS
jgi:hypothetical protein